MFQKDLFPGPTTSEPSKLKSMPAKIMLLIATDHGSGPLKGVLQLLRNIDTHAFDVHLYGFHYNNIIDQRLVDTLREHGITFRFLIQNNRSYLSLCRQTVQEIREHRFDLIQTHGFKPTFLAFVARLFCRVRWICFMHGTTNENLKVRMYNLLDSVLQRAADRTVLVSESQRRKILGGPDPRRVVVVHNAVDMDNPMPVSETAQPLRRRFDLPDAARIVVTVGRFSPEKGMDVLLDAFALLAQRVSNVHLVLVGDGLERSKLETQTRKLGLEGVVHFPGYSETPGDYVPEADVFVLPSRSEGIPNVVLEAMALGKPVVATAVGGVPEIITDGISGRLVPAEQPALLAQALAEVLSDPELYKRFAVEGQRRVRESFSVQARVAKLQTTYREVLGSREIH